uniref:Nectin cell adhesion molecule 3 n=1 Tax=Astyanax mexicanus TaxID=7994 RepID=A0A3B1KA65_ASTMX
LGKNVTLSCRVEVGTNLSLTQSSWERQSPTGTTTLAVFNPQFGTSVVEAYENRVQFVRPSAEDASIVLQGVSFADIGSYTCKVATFPLGNSQASTVLDVMVEPKVYVSAGSGPLVDGDVDSVVATCTAERARPPAEVFWESDLFGRSEKIDQDEPNGTTTTQVRYIWAPTSHAFGLTLTCVVRHPALDMEFRIPYVLDVQFAPDVMVVGQDEVWYVGQENVRLDCRANANPFPLKGNFSLGRGLTPIIHLHLLSDLTPTPEIHLHPLSALTLTLIIHLHPLSALITTPIIHLHPLSALTLTLIIHLHLRSDLTPTPIIHLHPLLDLTTTPIIHLHPLSALTLTPIIHLHPLSALTTTPIIHLHAQFTSPTLASLADGSVGTIVGGAVGGVLLLAMLLGLGVLCYLRQRRTFRGDYYTKQYLGPSDMQKESQLDVIQPHELMDVYGGDSGKGSQDLNNRGVNPSGPPISGPTLNNGAPFLQDGCYDNGTDCEYVAHTDGSVISRREWYV